MTDVLSPPSLEPDATRGMSVVRSCDTRQGLTAIATSPAELVIWRRTLCPALSRWLEDLPPSLLPNLRVETAPDALRPVLDEALDGGDTPAGEMRDRLVADVDSLVSIFAEISGSDVLSVRLQRIDDDACWRFHRDYVPYRLLTTYRGPATEWVWPRHAQLALRDQRDFSGPIERLSRHDVAIFEGSRNDSERGLVHRSPPMSGGRDPRLLLCVNMATA